MKVTAMAPWYGSNRMLGEHVGRALAGCQWVGLPFAGGMAEVPHIKARTLVINDKHRDIINLAQCVAVEEGCAWLVREAGKLLFHPDTLTTAQLECKKPWGAETFDAGRALWYFVCVWMGRSGKAGTNGELNGGLALRWNAGGGDSAVRFRNATEALAEWHRILSRATFSTLDVFDFLDQCHDVEGHGIYCDPPFPGPGDKYTHKFSEACHRKLVARLAAFQKTRIVCRFYDAPLVRELYLTPGWGWQRLVGRKMTNDEAPEVLLTRN